MLRGPAHLDAGTAPVTEATPAAQRHLQGRHPRTQQTHTIGQVGTAETGGTGQPPRRTTEAHQQNHQNDDSSRDDEQTDEVRHGHHASWSR